MELHALTRAARSYALLGKCCVISGNLAISLVTCHILGAGPRNSTFIHQTVSHWEGYTGMRAGHETSLDVVQSLAHTAATHMCVPKSKVI